MRLKLNWKYVIISYVIIILCITVILHSIFNSGENIESTSYTIKSAGGSFVIADFIPRLVKNIPNQTWTVSTSNNNAFDLDTYFIDDNGDPFSYTATGNSSIEITIDPGTNLVSFSQPDAWTGIEAVVFAAIQGENSVSSNTVILNVSGSGAADNTTEDDTGSGASSGGGGGGGGGISKKEENKPEKITDVSNLEVSLDLIKIQIKVGETITKSMTINNTGKTPMDIQLESPLKGIILFSETYFTLLPGESKSIEMEISSIDQIPDSYIGWIIVNGNRFQKEILTIIEVESAEVLFDLSLDIPIQSREIIPGGKLPISVNVYNLLKSGITKIRIAYFIKNLDGKVIYMDEEDIEITDQISIEKEFKIPDDTVPGDYVVIVQAKHTSSFGSATKVFEVIMPQDIIEQPAPVSKKPPIPLLIVTFIIIISGIILNSKKIKEAIKKQSKKVVKKRDHIIAAELKKSRLIKKLIAVEKAYKSGFVKKDVYDRDKKKIEKLLDKLGKT
ncbi:MAG: hypothetical protein ABIC04_03580 [Nanoarchaeota archaeon]